MTKILVVNTFRILNVQASKIGTNHPINEDRVMNAVGTLVAGMITEPYGTICSISRETVGAYCSAVEHGVFILGV